VERFKRWKKRTEACIFAHQAELASAKSTDESGQRVSSYGEKRYGLRGTMSIVPELNGKQKGYILGEYARERRTSLSRNWRSFGRSTSRSGRMWKRVKTGRMSLLILAPTVRDIIRSASSRQRGKLSSIKKHTERP
jgi:hypothetical protein